MRRNAENEIAVTMAAENYCNFDEDENMNGESVAGQMDKNVNVSVNELAENKNGCGSELIDFALSRCHESLDKLGLQFCN